MGIELGAQDLCLGFPDRGLIHDLLEIGQAVLLDIMIDRVGQHPREHQLAPVGQVAPEYERLVGQVIGQDLLIDGMIEKGHDRAEYGYRNDYPDHERCKRQVAPVPFLNDEAIEMGQDDGH